MSFMIKNLKESVKKSDNRIISTFADIYVVLYSIPRLLKKITSVPIFFISRLFPLQDKIVATAFTGKKYGDNPQAILEKIHEANPSIKIIWVKNPAFHYTTPEYIQTTPSSNYWKTVYELATAKIWISTHLIESHYFKRSHQLFIETWHGGLGVKKIELDSPILKINKSIQKKVTKTNQFADIFLSNSDHLTNIYKTAFNYTGQIWSIGFPKNDILYNSKEKETCRANIRDYLGIPKDCKIITYAPTFRDGFVRHGLNKSAFDIDFSMIKDCLKQKFGGNWFVIVRFHPNLKNHSSFLLHNNPDVLDATSFDDTQSLILACDAFISDYSSMIFDAAMTKIPCFTFATDYAEYENGRGLYYKLEDLPFPLATTNEELIENISHFDSADYESKWNDFKTRMGLIETDCSAEKIANLIIDVMKNGKGVIPNHIKEQ